MWRFIAVLGDNFTLQLVVSLKQQGSSSGGEGRSFMWGYVRDNHQSNLEILNFN